MCNLWNSPEAQSMDFILSGRSCQFVFISNAINHMSIFLFGYIFIGFIVYVNRETTHERYDA